MWKSHICEVGSWWLEMRRDGSRSGGVMSGADRKHRGARWLVGWLDDGGGMKFWSGSGRDENGVAF